MAGICRFRREARCEVTVSSASEACHSCSLPNLSKVVPARGHFAGNSSLSYPPCVNGASDREQVVGRVHPGRDARGHWRRLGGSRRHDCRTTRGGQKVKVQSFLVYTVACCVRRRQRLLPLPLNSTALSLGCIVVLYESFSALSRNPTPSLLLCLPSGRRQLCR